ncbi:MarR family transcriptional regulator [Anaerotignum lactatifermentans]|uniref:MarR family transcriptional regulator n=1 Tax=Anaerotignum lactatifermentans TaxID=160404 RepID=A0ABS2GCZ8_9FIRM|nr:MarR family transcriptional regulator [Anaerotignum lactatifermentans]MBM6830110.1 MarR family transcriptional regulator [Anaerotignum lactatifermentans]MBM6878658.1 MarR family transcriptional regulator [Anaerotignum lactatifermentans]MBM6951723.1 MarR family transcriptional regulator [Anaerotignum lactatifermentans]
MPDITNSPFKSVSILYRKSHIWLNNACLQYGLTAAQAVVILIICDFKTLTQDEITKRLALDKSVIAKTVTKLEELGFLVRSTNARDKRTYDISPTEKSWQIYPFIKEQIEVSFQRMTSSMTKKEQAQFQRLLAKAADAAIDFGE